ncbi:MAG: PKD domain-containing protein [Planctomycetes bacterium]|nr:PKD domain-containing protein [Planctomycetota bacterium]
MTLSSSDPGSDTIDHWTITWGDGTPAEAGSVSVTQGSPGVATTGTVTGTHTFANAGDFTVTVTVADDNAGSGSTSFILKVAPYGPRKFFVVDEGGQLHRTFRYDRVGNVIANNALNSLNGACA